MKWVMIVWTVWMTDGVPSVDIKSTEIYYPSQSACEAAMDERARMYAPFTEDGFGYTLQCRERDGKYADMGEEDRGAVKKK